MTRSALLLTILSLSAPALAQTPAPPTPDKPPPPDEMGNFASFIIHTGAGIASLLTGPVGAAPYQNVTDSVFVDVNAKYAK